MGCGYSRGGGGSWSTTPAPTFKPNSPEQIAQAVQYQVAFITSIVICFILYYVLGFTKKTSVEQPKDKTEVSENNPGEKTKDE